MQFASVLQLVRHAAPPQTYGMQLEVTGAAHPPTPSQFDTGEKVEPVHEAVPHVTAVEACWHAPAPLHAPVLPQGGLAGQPLLGAS